LFWRTTQCQSKCDCVCSYQGTGIVCAFYKFRFLSLTVSETIQPRTLTPVDVEEVHGTTIEFEEKCLAMSHVECIECKGIGLRLVVNGMGRCSRCQQKKKGHLSQKKALPSWIDQNGIERFDLPSELTGLSMAEKMLIQRISPFVPLHHLKNGTFGLTGHVCAFECDLEGFVNTLPRLSTDVTMLKVLRRMKQEIGNDKGDKTKAYRVRHEKVLNALRFLKKHNPECHRIQIAPENLAWLEGKDEGELEPLWLETDDIRTSSDNEKRNSDMGPAPLQGVIPNLENGDNVESYGYIDTGDAAELSEQDKEVNRVIQETVSNSKRKREITVDWPAAKDTPVSEFSDTRIFVNAFPWLFPGGTGDVKDWPGSHSK